MRYENRTPAEGINTDEVNHPLKEFLILTGLIALGAALIVVALGVSAQLLVKYVPFQIEKELAAHFETSESRSPSFAKEVAALQAVINKLLPGLNLPPGMAIEIHYVDHDVINAFATLGGHVIVFRGLLAHLPNENALAFVLAHEIAHVKHRHPAQALGRGVAMGLALTAISAGAGSAIAGRPLGAAGLLTVLKFTRDHESEADATALQALVRAYGDAGGALDLFKVFNESGRKQNGAPQFLLTHPLSEARSEAVREIAKAHGWALEGVRVALPMDLRKPAATPRSE